jgi:hypothetical protein
MQIARNNGFPVDVIYLLNNEIKQQPTQSDTNYTHWLKVVGFFHCTLIKKATNILKNPLLKITFLTTSAKYNSPRTKYEKKDKYLQSSSRPVYNIKCTCNKTYVGQTGINLKLRYHEHTRYIRNNSPQSAYAVHIVNHQHQFVTTNIQQRTW